MHGKIRDRIDMAHEFYSLLSKSLLKIENRLAEPIPHFQSMQSILKMKTP